LDWSNAQGTASGSNASFSIDFADARQHVALVRAHAETMRGHAQRLHEGLGGLNF
jgi:hypothetical protein